MWLLVGWILGHTTIGYAPFGIAFIVISLVLAIWLKKPICFFVVAFLIGQYHANFILEQHLQHRELKQSYQRVLVHVNELSTKKNQQIVEVEQPTGSVRWKAILNTELELGRDYYLEGNVKPIHTYAVAGVFDQEKWMLQQDIMATFLVKKVEPTSIRHGGVWIEQQRLKYRQYFTQHNFTQKGLMLALLTGDESLLDQKTQSLFKDLGISHLLAISGPHVLIFALMMSWFLHHILCWLYPRVYEKFPKHYVLALPFLACVLFYCAFVGFEIPALRTLFTTILITLTLCFRQKFSSSFIVLGSASLLLLVAPLSILSVAFWLSYGASFILLRVYQTVIFKQAPTLQAKCKLVFLQFIQAQAAIFIALLPITIFFFQEVAFISPISNLIAIPIIGGVVVPLEVFAAIIGGTFVFEIANTVLTVLVKILNLLPTHMSYIWLTPFQTACLGCAIVVLFLPKGVVPKVWILICLLPLVLPSKKPNFELTVLDVGQGQAVFVRSKNHQLLIDTGGSFNENKYSLADKVLRPYFVQQGVKSLDEVILSHLDKDHSGAFPKLKQIMPIHRVRSNEKHELCLAGQENHYDGVTIKILAPWRGVEQPSERNDQSCVVYITYQKQHFLIMGDAGFKTEQQLMQHYPRLPVDVLVLGHHGSKFSSSPEFLAYANPKLAIASAGQGNTYGHPSLEVQERLKQLHIPLFVTADKGSIYFNEDVMSFYRDHRRWLQR